MDHPGGSDDQGEAGKADHHEAYRVPGQSLEEGLYPQEEQVAR